MGSIVVVRRPRLCLFDLMSSNSPRKNAIDKRLTFLSLSRTKKNMGDEDPIAAWTFNGSDYFQFGLSSLFLLNVLLDLSSQNLIQTTLVDTPTL